MGLKMSKRYFSYSFHLISAKLYEDIGYHGRIQNYFSLEIRQFKNFCGTLHF